MAKVKKRVLTLSQGTNQAMRSHIVLRIKSLVEVTCSHGCELICVEMFQVTCARCVCSKKEDKVDCNPLWSNIEKKWHMKILKTQVVKLVIFSCS